MTTSISPDYFFITAVPTQTWSQVLRLCRTSSFCDEPLSSYEFDANAGLTLDVRPFREVLDTADPQPYGTFFSERYHQHTFMDIVNAVREGTLNDKVLTYPRIVCLERTQWLYISGQMKQLFSLPREAMKVCCLEKHSNCLRIS